MKSVFLFASVVSSAALAQSAAYSPTVYLAGVTKGTVFPSLAEICATDDYVSVPGRGMHAEFPYDSIIGNSPIIGRTTGEISGCESNLIKFTGSFIDLTFKSNPSTIEACEGSIEVTENTNTGTMKIKWLVKQPYRDSKCSNIGKSFAVTLKATTVSELKFPNLTYVEFEMTHSKQKTYKLIAENSILLNARFDSNGPIKIKAGAVLESTYCDRGGADFPEAGVCYYHSANGKAEGFLQSVTKPKTQRGWTDLTRSRFTIEKQ